MNEKIQELIKQAMVLDDDELFVREVFDREKFALLIVQECAQLVQGVPTDTMGYRTADQKIKQHFGVE